MHYFGAKLYRHPVLATIQRLEPLKNYLARCLLILKMKASAYIK